MKWLFSDFMVTGKEAVNKGYDKDIAYALEKAFRRGYCHGAFITAEHIPADKHAEWIKDVSKWRLNLRKESSNSFKFPPHETLKKYAKTEYKRKR